MMKNDMTFEALTDEEVEEVTGGIIIEDASNSYRVIDDNTKVVKGIFNTKNEAIEFAKKLSIDSTII